MSFKKRQPARLLSAEQAMQKNSTVVRQLKKDVLTTTMKAGKQIGTITGLLERDENGVDALKKEKDTSMQW